MAVILEKDLTRGRQAYEQWRDAAMEAASACDAATESEISKTAATRTGAPLATRLSIAPKLPRPVMAMAVRYSLFLLERKAPGPGVEVRVAPWGAIKILDGPESDPHNLTPPDVIELDPDVWLRLAAGITTWDEEKEAGRISAVGERDDLGWLLPL
ncbi:hypothetical protein JS531_10190 [Bifidobacterium sp. CP2]|uniref:sterol carrier family protein n=1 Tax=Bifidobacterium sp. CP2 TaxID=2809025 RepID=UPI001BDBF62A|nr:sterol carrier family protein [Bifidobacterium sp. CP2]MBT1182306.1 hypothetical protein [Bifidobacterium sp. CP2]